ncbi:scaffold attachment factor B2-like isoform X3 [Alosa alosa]|uniref:scaffold attachment factor B2-like isoform X2 n=1 Tax=Alosa alosa TaxID=278164 RepID=UPI0020153D7F|nr:scaffold attachment factor B2-like isoform X2 [Alosa alosa]XP_048113584.1 scaffold attachment factor B2-like isoform X3 [Alosa alosa]
MDDQTTKQYTYNFTISDTTKLIELRTEHDALFDGKKNGAKVAWSLILKEMGLEGVVTTEQLSKKWDNMKRKYKELKCPGPGMEKEAAKGMVTWHWFSMLDKTLGDKFPLPSVAMTTEDSCASLSTKRVCLVQLGTDVLKLLPNTPLPENTETASEHSESGPGMHLGVEIASLRRERLCMERDQAEVEIASLRRERLGMERDQAEVERERLLLERERKLLERERAAMERDRTQLRRDWATVERDRTAVQRDKVRLEKDLASLERDKVAVAREREQLSKDHENNIAHSEANASTLEDRQKLRSLFKKLIEKF